MSQIPEVTPPTSAVLHKSAGNLATHSILVFSRYLYLPYFTFSRAAMATAKSSDQHDLEVLNAFDCNQHYGPAKGNCEHYDPCCEH